VTAGPCTRGLRICKPQHAMLPNIFSNPRVRLHSLTNTQGLPLYRLSIMPSQNASMHIPSPLFCIRWEVTHVVNIARGICCLPLKKVTTTLTAPLRACVRPSDGTERTGATVPDPFSSLTGGQNRIAYTQIVLKYP